MTIDPVERTNLLLSAGAVAASLALTTPSFALSLAVGSALETFNFRGLRRSAQFLFWGEIRSGGGWNAIFALRFSLLVLGIGAALYYGAHPFGLLIGLSLIVPAVVIEAWRARPPVDPEAKALAADDPAWEQWNAWFAREEEPDEDGLEASDKEPGA